ncbi:winged helix DNA-binding domain-containing protein [Haladaptatus sp. DJG-WS-42]|uniref:winged helix DNA-binding domain-containing protein n=1 Tax=Haladaptatus sp. DJG-WS-42 TaxID=3120516 RepID=UPI0030CC153E
MERTFSDDELRRLRLRSQLLDTGTSATDVPAVLSRVCGLQAQDASAATLGIRTRSSDVTAADVDAALFESRRVVRTWCMRGTLHLVATEDVPWLLSVFGPVFVARSRKRLSDLGFDDDASANAVETIHDAIDDHGPLTRAEIAELLQRAGFAFDARGQAPFHLIRRAALQGLVCKVAPVDGGEAYGLLNEWVKPQKSTEREAGLRTLARRYLSAYQPASLDDFASWSKLPMADVRAAWAAIEDERTVVRDGADRIEMLANEIPRQGNIEESPLRLLPRYDTYLLGYASREFAVSPAEERNIWPGGGVIRPTVIHDGRAIATWKLDRSKRETVVVVVPFDEFPTHCHAALDAEVADIGRFLDMDVGYRIEET